MEFAEYLTKKGVEYHKPGEKNVSHGWINIQCPFCNDHSWHCGINMASGLFHCWLCGCKGDSKKIIYKFEKSWPIANQIRSQITFNNEPISNYRGARESLNMPPGVSRTPNKIHTRYLKYRRFDPDEVTNKYGLYFGGTVGAYRHSIIIPVYSDGQAVCFIAADCTRQRYKYKKSPYTINVLNHSECLYNFNDQDEVTIVEGVFDAWRVNGVALLTKNITATQLKKLAGKKIKLFLDPDAQKEAERIAGLIWWTSPKIVISDKEPDEL